MKRQFTTTEILDKMSRNYYADAMLAELNKNSNSFTDKVNILVDMFFDEKAAAAEGYFMKDLDLGYESLTRSLINTVKSEIRLANNTKLYSSIEPKVTENLEVGSILYASWGYDQTNIDFYCVVAETAHMVTLIPMTKNYNEDGFMSGKSVAHKIDFEAETFRAKKSSYIKVSSCSNATLWRGEKLYESHYA